MLAKNKCKKYIKLFFFRIFALYKKVEKDEIYSI